MPSKCDGASRRSALRGYVYMAFKDLQKICFKVGFSRYCPSHRVTRYRKCYDGVKLAAYTSIIHHAPRIEQLAHWELDDYRRRDNCDQYRCVLREWLRYRRRWQCKLSAGGQAEFAHNLTELTVAG
jgi:hypothetical protein